MCLYSPGVNDSPMAPHQEDAMAAKKKLATLQARSFFLMVTHSKKKTWLSRLFWKEHSLRQENKCTLEWRMMDPWIIAPSIGSKYQRGTASTWPWWACWESQQGRVDLEIWRVDRGYINMVDISREIDGCLIGLFCSLIANPYPN